jgi:DNA sulfur modification protein DndD
VILLELTLENFGVFRGRQTINLAPARASRPIVLIGGLNGTGKTTILDAIQLGLFGKRARLSKRAALSYDDYIRRSMNRERSDMGITIRFERFIDGIANEFHVSRRWTAVRDNIAEKTEIRRNGELDRVLTDTWAEYIEEVIPLEIAQLFFFDAEKIESFADPEASRQTLSKALDSLLGLDVVTRLGRDLLVLERRKRAELASDIGNAEVEAISGKLEAANVRNEDLFQQRASAQNEVDRRSKHLREIEEKYRAEGGALFDQREELERQLQEARSEFEDALKRLRNLCEGEAPLLLVRDLLAEIWEQKLREEDALKSFLVDQVLDERDEKLLRLIASLGITSDDASAIRTFLSEDRDERRLNDNSDSFQNLSPDAAEDLRKLVAADLERTESEFRSYLNLVESQSVRLGEIEKKLGGVPEPDAIKAVVAEMDRARADLAEAEVRLSVVDGELRRAESERSLLENSLASKLEKLVDDRYSLEDASRIIEHSARVRETLEKFRTRTVERKCGHIAELMLDSLTLLLRKKSFISELRIDPASFALELFDSEGRSIRSERLSAGERQLLAVSMLWGLARASGCPLPVAIDTPLGRLDSEHRINLVENYFPKASHQVILLSTNKEIDSELYNVLDPFVSRAYRLDYSDKLRATEIREGYFDGDLSVAIGTASVLGRVHQ